jgi:hypothetical protein
MIVSDVIRRWLTHYVHSGKGTNDDAISFLADQLELSRGSLTRIIQGAQTPTTKYLERLATATGWPIEMFSDGLTRAERESFENALRFLEDEREEPEKLSRLWASARAQVHYRRDRGEAFGPGEALGPKEFRAIIAGLIAKGEW